MIEYEVQWTPCPTAYNETRVIFIEAANPDDAKEIARDHIKRRHGIGGWIKFEIKESVPVPSGRVKE